MHRYERSCSFLFWRERCATAAPDFRIRVLYDLKRLLYHFCSVVDRGPLNEIECSFIYKNLHSIFLENPIIPPQRIKSVINFLLFLFGDGVDHLEVVLKSRAAATVYEYFKVLLARVFRHQ